MKMVTPKTGEPDMTTRKKRPISTGEMISSFAFGIVSLWLMDAAMTSDGLRAVGIWACALACLAGAFRYIIARLLTR